MIFRHSTFFKWNFSSFFDKKREKNFLQLTQLNSNFFLLLPLKRSLNLSRKCNREIEKVFFRLNIISFMSDFFLFSLRL